MQRSKSGESNSGTDYEWLSAARTEESLTHEPVARVTLAEANQQRDWRLWQDLATGLIKRVRRLYAGEDLRLELDETIYALESMTIDLSLQLFPWAEFRSTKAGVKLHTQLDLRGPIPVRIEVRAARSHDVLWLDTLIFRPGAFYLLDCAYMDFVRLAKIARTDAFFVTRAKDNLRFSRFDSNPKVFDNGVSSDQVRQPILLKAREALPWPLRRIRFVDPDTGKKLVFPTNHLEVPVTTVAAPYKNRWHIELFFPWIKQSKAARRVRRSRINMAGQALDKVRKDLARKGADLRGGLWALRSNAWTRNSEQRERRSQLMAAYPALGRAVALRELLQDALAGSDRAQLEGWLASAQRSRLAAFRDLARTIKRHFDGILAYIETRLNNGVMEAINGLLQLAKRISRGFQNFHYFRLVAYLKAGGLNLQAPRLLPT